MKSRDTETAVTRARSTTARAKMPPKWLVNGKKSNNNLRIFTVTARSQIS